jgi:hypothetical protein
MVAQKSSGSDMEETILARKTVTKTYVIGDREYPTLDEAKEAALIALIGATPVTVMLLLKNAAAVAAILLSKGHRKRGPRKKKVADPAAGHPLLPMVEISNLPEPIAQALSPFAPKMTVPAEPPKNAGTKTAVARPGSEFPDLSTIEMPPCSI